jgi:hypothetical protein
MVVNFRLFFDAKIRCIRVEPAIFGQAGENAKGEQTRVCAQPFTLAAWPCQGSRSGHDATKMAANWNRRERIRRLRVSRSLQPSEPGLASLGAEEVSALTQVSGHWKGEHEGAAVAQFTLGVNRAAVGAHDVLGDG